MKRVGDANEKAFEKVPRRQEPRGDDQDEQPEQLESPQELDVLEAHEEEFSEQTMQLGATDFGFRDGISLEEGNDNGDREIPFSDYDLEDEFPPYNYRDYSEDTNPHEDEEEVDERDYVDARDRRRVRHEGEVEEDETRTTIVVKFSTFAPDDLNSLLKLRLSVDKFGVYCYFCLKEFGLLSDIISLILPSVQFLTLWKDELAKLRCLQSRRINDQSRVNREMIRNIRFVEQLQEEVDSVRILRHLFSVGIIPFTDFFFGDYLTALRHAFTKDYPFILEIAWECGSALKALLSEGTMYCSLNPAKLRREESFFLRLFESARVFVPKLLNSSREGNYGSWLLILIADLMRKIVNLAMSLEEYSVVKRVAIFEKLCGYYLFNQVFDYLFFEFSREIEFSAELHLAIPHIFPCIGIFPEFLGSAWYSDRETNFTAMRHQG